MNAIPALALSNNPAPGSDGASGASSEPPRLLFADPTAELMDFNSEHSFQHDDQLTTHVAFGSTAAL